MLVESAYGKSRIRLVQVRRRGTRHTLTDLTVAIRFEGDYGSSYSDGDNADVLPTDTMKNTVYALAAREPVAEPEAFGLPLGRHFLERNPKLTRVRVDLTDHALAPGDRRRPRSRTRVHAPRPGRAHRDRAVSTRQDDGRRGRERSVILKSSRSAFAGFPRDEFTTLPETTDRLLATALTATWHYAEDDCPFGSVLELVRQTLLESFAEHDSQSVQHTLYAMGQAVLEPTTTSARSAWSCRTGTTCPSTSRRSASRTATRSSSRPRSRTA